MKSVGRAAEIGLLDYKASAFYFSFFTELSETLPSIGQELSNIEWLTKIAIGHRNSYWLTKFLFINFIYTKTFIWRLLRTQVCWVLP